MPAFNQFFAGGDIVIGVYEQIIGSVAIHAGFADDGANAAPGSLGEKDIGGFRIGRTEDQAGGCTVCQLCVKETPGFGFCACRSAEVTFLGIGVAFQPTEQGFTVAADHVDLRKMNMRIDKTGDDNTILEDQSFCRLPVSFDRCGFITCEDVAGLINGDGAVFDRFKYRCAEFR